MKLTPTVKQQDPRTEPLPLFIRDDGLAEQIQFAGNSQDAWQLLKLAGERGDMDPDVMDKLAAAATALCAVGDSIGKGLRAFGALDPDAEVPDGWVDRMVELHRAYLVGYWALDDLAWAGAKAGGWTVSTRETLVDDPAARIAQRARWVTEELKRPQGVLGIDRLDRALDRCVEGAKLGLDPASTARLDAVKEAAQALVGACCIRRFAGWQITRRSTGG